MNKILYGSYKTVICIVLALPLFSSCSISKTKNHYLVFGESAGEVELNTVKDFQTDLQKVVSGEVIIQSEKESLPEDSIVIVLGTITSNQLLSEQVKANGLELSSSSPGPRGGIWAKVELSNEREAIVLAGSDVQGMQYAVYDYAKEVLGIDPLAYWTGKEPDKGADIDLFAFENKKIAPPKVPILCYFENDVDELANYRGKLLEYDWESYTEMINSLVRLRYNAIQFFDMLGRPEFFIRPEYKALSPEYKVNIAYLDRMIDYAHKKGMKVQIDFALGYKIHPISLEEANCWSVYKEEWIKAWRYYLEETPLAKTDIFVLRPRHQVWDWEYESSCGENKIEVFNSVYNEFGTLVDQYNPEAKKVLICYADGMQMYNDGFRPPKDWIVAWSDDGFGDFEYLPKDTSGYNFGTYMHAGFWLNHTVHNPYPNKVETIMKDMFQNYNADTYCMVNGQNFRPFLLNLEAYSEVCNNSRKFNSETFYREWTKRYFGEEAGKYAVASMEWLHKAQEGRKGYVQHLWEIREAVAYLSNAPIERPGKTPVPFDFKRIEKVLTAVKNTEGHIDKAVLEAQKGLGNANLKGNFYHSYIYLPVVIYSDLIAFERTLHKMSLLKKQFEDTNDPKFLGQAVDLLEVAKKDLELIYAHRNTGDKDIKWTKWYSPKIRRPNNGFPNVEMLQTIATNLKSKR